MPVTMKTIEIRRHSIRTNMHNIAEGFESGYDPEFARFLKMALDADFITQEELKKAYDLTTDAKKLINGMISYPS